MIIYLCKTGDENKQQQKVYLLLIDPVYIYAHACIYFIDLRDGRWQRHRILHTIIIIIHQEYNT